MLEIKQDEADQTVHYVRGTKSGKIFYTGTAEGCILFIKRRKTNYKRRMLNQALREICGTSAAAARRDMGLNSGGY